MIETEIASKLTPMQRTVLRAMTTTPRPLYGRQSTAAARMRVKEIAPDIIARLTDYGLRGWRLTRLGVRVKGALQQ